MCAIRNTGVLLCGDTIATSSYQIIMARPLMWVIMNTGVLPCGDTIATFNARVPPTKYGKTSAVGNYDTGTSLS